MPKLIADGRTPLTVADIMRQRLAAYRARVQDQELANNWLLNYYDTASGIGSNGDNVRIVQSAQPLLEVNPKSKLSDGALIITPDTYRSLGGVERTRAQLEKAGINNWLPKDRVLAHPVWQALAGGDGALLRDYAEMVFDVLKTDTAMGIYVTNEQGPSLRPWILNVIGGRYRSFAGDGGRLGDAVAQLVEMALGWDFLMTLSQIVFLWQSPRSALPGQERKNNQT